MASQDGIGYFPLDTGFLRDKKVLLIKGKYGAKGILILIYILSRIYEEHGYFIKWDEDDCFLSADAMGCGISPELTTQVVNECIVRSMFHEQLYNEFGILTSHGIQWRFLRAAKKRENIEFYKEYFLLDTSNPKDVPKGILNKVTFLSAKVSGNNEKVSGNTEKVSVKRQSKVKESKGNKSKAEESNRTVTYVPDENLNRAINDFVAYRKGIKKPMTDRAVTLLIERLGSLSRDPDEQIAILNQSIINGWQGVFPLKEDNRGKRCGKSNRDYDEMLREWAEGADEQPGVFDHCVDP